MNKQVICTACQTPAGWVIWFGNTDLHTAAFICAYGQILLQSVKNLLVFGSGFVYSEQL